MHIINYDKMTKKFTLLQLFSIVDGRLSTTIDDVYNILNHICDDNLMTHHLPVALNYLKEKNPSWFNLLTQELNLIKDSLHTNDFKLLITYIEANNIERIIPQLKDEFDTSDFGDYMVTNSLLLK